MARGGPRIMSLEWAHRSWRHASAIARATNPLGYHLSASRPRRVNKILCFRETALHEQPRPRRTIVKTDGAATSKVLVRPRGPLLDIFGLVLGEAEEQRAKVECPFPADLAGELAITVGLGLLLPRLRFLVILLLPKLRSFL